MGKCRPQRSLRMGGVGGDVAGDDKDDFGGAFVEREGKDFVEFGEGMFGAEGLHALALERPQAIIAPGDEVAALFAASGAEVFGALVALALDEPEAFKVAGGELVEGEGVSCGGDWGLGWRHCGFLTGARGPCPHDDSSRWKARWRRVWTQGNAF
jgi:hypothetical protein